MQVHVPVSALPIPSGLSKTKKPKHNHSTSSFGHSILFLILLLINLCSFLSHGVIIANPSLHTSSPSINYSLLSLLPFLSNIIFTCIPQRIYHKLFNKLSLCLSLFIHICAICLFYFFNHYIINYASRLLTGLTQTVISIYSIQWCLHFANERNRLKQIHLISTTPLLAYALSFLLETTLTNKITLLIEAIVLLCCLTPLVFVHSERLENKTLTLTKEFLNKSIEYSDTESIAYLTSKDKVCYIIIIYILIFIHMCIFSRTLFSYNNNTYDDLLYWIIFKSLTSFVLPLLGLIISYALCEHRSYTTLLIVLSVCHIVLLLSAVALYFNTNIVNALHLHNMQIFNSIVYAVVSFTNVFVFPFAYTLISNLIYGMTCINGITVVVNIALIAGCVSLIFDNDIIIFNSLCIGAFVMFSMFVIASLCGKLRVRLEGKLRVCESYLFLVMGSIFGKYILFVWDECQEGDVDVDMEVNEWKGDLLMGDDSLDCGNEEDKVRKYEPSISSKMTFNKAYANGNNAWKKESSVVLKDNNNVSIGEEEEERGGGEENDMDIFSFRKND